MNCTDKVKKKKKQRNTVKGIYNYQISKKIVAYNLRKVKLFIISFIVFNFFSQKKIDL